MNQKLLSPLCRTCADLQQTTPCVHNTEERVLEGTWVTDEIKVACRKGYQIISIYEVRHFNTTSQYDPASKTGGLFTGYIDKFLKLKQQASGWPSWCVNEEDRQRYIDEYQHREGIRLDYHAIEKNPGLRSLAKLMLNR